MHVPHFGGTVKVNTCMKKLLVCFHGLFLWIDSDIYVYVELISTITWIPKAGVDSTSFFSKKEHDLNLVTGMKEKYNITRVKRVFYIASYIIDTTIQF